MTSEIEKAEIIQSIKAFLIPSSLFVAVIINSAGGFLVYNGYPVGWALVAFSAIVIISAFVAFVKFQNKLRARGKFSRPATRSSDDLQQDPVRTMITPEETQEISPSDSIRTAITLEEENIAAKSSPSTASVPPPPVVTSSNPAEPVR